MGFATRSLGKGGPQVTAIGYGMMGLSMAYGQKLADDQRFALLDHIYDSGQRFWDSADMYGDNEDLIGRWFQMHPERRKEIFLCTKFGNVLHPDGTRGVNSSPEYCLQACNKSLKRLGTDYIDLYYIHRLKGDAPVEPTIRAMAELKKEGKIKHLGISECSAETLRRAHNTYPITAVQLEYSPFALDIETDQINLLKTARELGVAIVAYSPVGRGMLTGTLTSPDQFDPTDFRSRAPRFSKENFHKNLELVDALKKIAAEKGCTPAQLSIAWLLAQGDDIIPIPGTTKIERYDENMGALGVNLTKEENAKIRDMCKKLEPTGERYPPAMLNFVFMDTPPE